MASGAGKTASSTPDASHGAEASGSGGASSAADAQTLTSLLRVFRVNYLDFFRALRKFMMAVATSLNARVKKAALAVQQPAGAGTMAAAANDDRANAELEASASETVSNTGEGLKELEGALMVSEVRTSYAFTTVAAQKYKVYFDLHFDESKSGGEFLARFGWRLYLVAKHIMLPKFPDLYSCYHLLVVVQAFLLVNAPPCLLRTTISNMVSMSVKDESGGVDALASLCATTKTKLDYLRSMLIDFQTEVVEKVIASEMAKVTGGKTMHLVPSENPGDDLSPKGPNLYPDLFRSADGGEDDTEAAAFAAAAAAAGSAYEAVAADLGHLWLDERLYLTYNVEEEADALAVLGDTSKAPAAGGSGGVAATPGRPGFATPWRRGPLSPSRLPSRLANHPYSPLATSGRGPSLRGGGSKHDTPEVPFTPIFEAMNSASWLQTIVSPATGGGKDPVERLSRFVSPDVAKKVMDNVHTLSGKTSAALRADAFLVTSSVNNASFDALVERRQAEAVQVFAHFLLLILEEELKKGAKSMSDAEKESQESKKLIPPRRNSVLDIAVLAAEETKTPEPSASTSPTAEQRATFSKLLDSSRFVRSVLACSMEVVVRSYKTATLKFPAIPELLDLTPFDVTNIFETFVSVDTTMPREVKKHFNDIEESIMEHMAWMKGSNLFGFMKAAATGTPPPGPAAAALAAVSSERPAVHPDEDRPGEQKEMRRRRSFSVAAVGEEAADEPLSTSDRNTNNGSSNVESSPVGGAERVSVLTAFSTPLRGALTPARSRANKFMSIHEPSASGAEPEPLPKRIHNPPSGGNVTAQDYLRYFFGRVLTLSKGRVIDMIVRLKLGYGPDELLARQALSVVSHVLYEHTWLLYNRHLDQILLCAVYGVCKSNKDSLLKGRSVPFRELISVYRRQPQSRQEIYWTVILQQTDPGLEVKQQGDIITFYNKVFVPEVKNFLLNPKPVPHISESGGTSGAHPAQSPLHPSGAMPSMGDTPRSPLSTAYSPHRVNSGKQNVYVSPMRANKAVTSLTQCTPRSKSLFALMGESTQPFQSPSNDLKSINRRMALSAASAAEAMHSTNGSTAAGVEGAELAAERGRRAGAVTVLPPAAASGSVRPRSVDDADDGPDDGRPTKSARQSNLGNR